MIFPMGSTFIFGSCICEAKSEGNLQGRLVEAWKAREEITLPTGSTEDLAERFLGLTVSESTQAPTTTSLDLVSGSDSSLESNPGSFRRTEFFSNWTPERSINSSRDQFEPTSGFFREVESPPNRT
jgi:hypothetical protein